MLRNRLTGKGTWVQVGVLAATGVVLAALTVAAWYGWLGWDHEYQLDPVTAVVSGPYEASQVVGCVLTLIALALAAGVLVDPRLPVLVMPLAFTMAWSIDAAGQDDTGLWAVGAIMILVGTVTGAGALAALAAGLLRVTRRRPAALKWSST